MRADRHPQINKITHNIHPPKHQPSRSDQQKPRATHRAITHQNHQTLRARDHAHDLRSPRKRSRSRQEEHITNHTNQQKQPKNQTTRDRPRPPTHLHGARRVPNTQRFRDTVHRTIPTNTTNLRTEREARPTPDEQHARRPQNRLDIGLTHYLGFLLNLPIQSNLPNLPQPINHSQNPTKQ